MTEAEAIAAVERNGFALRFVPEALRTAELCLAAVEQDGGAILFVPAELQDEVQRRAA
jgi:hypothetical protein